MIPTLLLCFTLRSLVAAAAVPALERGANERESDLLTELQRHLETAAAGAAAADRAAAEAAILDRATRRASAEPVAEEH